MSCAFFTSYYQHNLSNYLPTNWESKLKKIILTAQENLLDGNWISFIHQPPPLLFNCDKVNKVTKKTKEENTLAKALSSKHNQNDMSITITHVSDEKDTGKRQSDSGKAGLANARSDIFAGKWASVDTSASVGCRQQTEMPNWFHLHCVRWSCERNG